MSLVDLMAGGEFLIFNGAGLARNLPGGGQQGPQMSAITVTTFSGVYSRWVIQHAESEGAFNISNAGSKNKAFVEEEEKDQQVWGYSEKGSKFAIERSGSGQYIIKVVNKDLLWTVGDDGDVSLAPANGSPQQQFRFEHVSNAEVDQA